jgi:hypothetical protein
MGRDFDFAALTEVDDSVREEILEELETETVAEGVRELDADDAVYILEDLDRDEQAEILDKLPALERLALQRALDYPEDSAGRRMQTEFIAVRRSGPSARPSILCARPRRSPETFLRDLRRRPASPADRHRSPRQAPAQQAPGDDRGDHVPTTRTWCARRTTRRTSRGSSSATTSSRWR